jgi:Beta-lactamase
MSDLGPLRGLTQNRLQPYGMGWFIGREQSVEVLFHTGSWQGFRAVVVRYPAQKKSLVVFVNTDATKAAPPLAAIIPIAFPGMPLPPTTASLKPYDKPN